MGKFSPKPKLPAAPPPLPTPEDPAIQEKKDKDAAAAKRRQGFGSTVLTKGLGSPAGEDNVKRTKLGS